jgi:alanine-glyoxylate transaminase/serine-glyoxylate transaminase/serine-pyruvate transaminase
MQIPGPLNVPRRILMGPGPSEVPPRVLAALSAPLLGHLDPQFLEIMNDTQELLRQTFRTNNRLTFPVSGTGSAGMETCVVNLIEPGDRMVVCVNGVFGQRMTDVATRAGAQVTTIERPWGEVFELEAIREVLKRIRPKVLGIVHAETSTGACQPAEELGKLCHEFDTLLLLDTVTSLGGIPCEIDRWEVDAVYSGTQKCLSCPPGLSPVSFSSRAVDAINARKTKVQSWYLDMGMVQRYWAEERFYHHTAPISMIYALREALQAVHEEGLEARWARHQRNHQALKAGLAALGIGYLAAEGRLLPMLNAVRVPAGADDARIRRKLLDEFGIEIGGGLGEFKGKAWRIGLMGAGSRPENVLFFLAALEQCLMSQKISIVPGSGIAAANGVYLGAA